MTPTERIFELIQESGKSEYAIKKETGLPNSIFSEWKAGRARPSADALSKIADYFNVTVDYLLGRTDKRRDSLAERFPSEDILYLPVYATVEAGFNKGIEELDDGDLQEIPLSVVRGYNKEDLFVFLVQGESMKPVFLPGDRVLVSRQTSVDNGDIAIVSYDGFLEGTIKKVFYDNGYIDLVPLNTKFDTVRIEGDDLETCCVVGKVIYLFRKI